MDEIKFRVKKSIYVEESGNLSDFYFCKLCFVEQKI